MACFVHKRSQFHWKLQNLTRNLKIGRIREYGLLDIILKSLPQTQLQYLRQALYFLTFPWVIRGKTQLG